MVRRLSMLLMLSLVCSLAAQEVPGRLVVVYRAGRVPAGADAMLRLAGSERQAHMPEIGVSAVSVPVPLEALSEAWLRQQPGVAMVLHDRIVQGLMPVRVQAVAKLSVVGTAPHGAPQRMDADSAYGSAAGWAVKAAGGYGGQGVAGPWTVSMGAGVRLAVLDSGVDEMHPDLAPNLALNLSEVDRTALPSACDDGSPQDQQGHGTWAASLAAAAVGGGDVIGVAPQATLLNIKVMERLPAATAGGDGKAQCEAGQAGGLLSWVLAGINDAIAEKADVISLSLGTLVDVSTGDGAGWQASFDRVTHAAALAGVVIVAAAGNDGMDLSGGRYVELPAQARDVLAVTAATNSGCAENLAAGAVCAAGPVSRPYYSNYGGAVLNAIAAPGGSYPENADATAVSGWVYGACSSGVPGTADGLPGNGASFGCFGLGHVQYVQAMGTSASAPLVAGAAAILRASRPGWTAEQIVAALRGSATSLPRMAEPELNLAGALGLP